MGDRATGKTEIALDTIINQQGKDVICNADCNGSLNIGFKSKQEGFGRVSRVCLTQPVRVNVLQDSRIFIFDKGLRVRQ